ncbi:MAG: glycosyltransferase family 2 protein [Halochromatium sp.]|nr:glycosyltransferase family 2 protein [Halochromatium sp.]
MIEPTQTDISVIIVSFNTRDLLRDCLQTLLRHQGGLRLQTIVVDNASEDGSAEMVAAEFPEVLLIRSPVNLGFGRANNRGFEQARGRYVVLLNSDAFIDEDTLQHSVARMDAEPDVGLASGRLVGREGEWQPSARMFPSLLNEFLTLSGLSARWPKSRFFGRVDRTWADPLAPADVDWVPGAYSIIRASVLEQIGHFDERFFLYFEEVDLCRRIKAAGYRIAYWPEIQVVHIGGESSRTIKRLTFSGFGSQLTLWRMRSQALYHRKHQGLLGAWLSMQLESLWHRLRRWRNRISDSGERRAKAEESAVIVKLWRQAWRETERGRVSPPQPW